MSSLKTERLILQVLRDTSKGDVNWQVGDPPESLIRGTDNYIPLYLEAKYKGKDIAVYEVRYKYYRDEDDWSWSADVKFIMLSGDVVVLETDSYSPALSQLFTAARSDAAGLDDLLDDLLDN
ncbi:hypothetical protein [Pseudomonas nitroreducens]|uniref:hypothetical protein n=1 Tax=Pseudomonas nitroreducens TaxID=46680 RepID=UPI003D2CA026